MKRTLLIAMLALACADLSEAQRRVDVGRTTTVSGPNGKTASKVVSGSAGDGVWARDVVKTGPNGKTVSSSGSGTYGGGTVNGTVKRTGPKGKTRTYGVHSTKN